MVDDARQENNAHRVAIDAADSLAQVRDEMDRHEAMMDGMMGTMGTEMDGMTHCTGAGMQDLRDMHGDMNGEMDQHGAVMDQSTDLDTASAEVTRHVGVMDEMVDGMDVASDRMGC